MKPIKDEALHSWIYRCLLVNGGGDFSCIINNVGRWSLDFVFPVKYMQFFTFPSDNDLFQLFLKASTGLEYSIINTPWEFAFKVKNMLGKEVPFSNKRKSIAIKYCSACIGESIEEIGFGYFKSDWFFGNRCEKHNVVLALLLSKSRRENLRLLRVLLSGRELVANSINSNKNLPQNNYNETRYFMPCFIEKFNSSIADSLNLEHPLNYEFSSNYSVDDFTSKNILLSYVMGNDLITRNLRDYPDKTYKLIKVLSEEVVYKYGINQIDSLSTHLITKKRRNCTKCLKWAFTGLCPLNPLIRVATKVGN